MRAGRRPAPPPPALLLPARSLPRLLSPDPPPPSSRAAPCALVPSRLSVPPCPPPRPWRVRVRPSRPLILLLGATSSVPTPTPRRRPSPGPLPRSTLRVWISFPAALPGKSAPTPAPAPRPGVQSQRRGPPACPAGLWGQPRAIFTSPFSTARWAPCLRVHFRGAPFYRCLLGDSLLHPLDVQGLNTLYWSTSKGVFRLKALFCKSRLVLFVVIALGPRNMLGAAELSV